MKTKPHKPNIILLIILLLLTGCSKKITEGEVYDKEYKESYTTVRLIPIVTSNGKTTSTRMIPYVYRYPERWVIRIKDFDSKNDKWIYEEYYVNKYVYDEIGIGDTFKYDKNRDYKEEPYERGRQ